MKTVTWLLLGLCLLALVPLAAQQLDFLQSKNPVTVRDTKGKQVGVLIDVGGITDVAFPYPVVLLKTGQQFVTLGAKPDRLRGNRNAILFTTSNCTGTPYFQFIGQSLIAYSFVTNDGGLYMSRPAPTVRTVNIGSAYGAEENFPNAQPCTPQTYANQNIRVLAAEPVGNIYQEFQPPFTLK